MRRGRAGLGALLGALATMIGAPGQAGPALEGFAGALARGEYGSAWELLSAADQRAMDRATFVGRYRRLERLPWVAAVLKTARVEAGRLTALDWSYTRFARRGLLARSSRVPSLPPRRYLEGARVRQGRLYLGLDEPREEVGQARAKVLSADADWFALYLRIWARCPRGARHLLLEVTGPELRGSLAHDCTAPRGREELVLWAPVAPRRLRGLGLSVRVRAVVFRRCTLDPFRAPDPDLLEDPALPLVP